MRNAFASAPCCTILARSAPRSHSRQTGTIDERRQIVKCHPTTGHILQPLHSLQDVIPIIRWHHERCDGRGYPDGLTKNQIPEMVRVLSVADVYDSLSSNRPYRPAMSAEECRRVLWLEAEQGNLDPRLVEAFCDLMPLPIWNPMLRDSGHSTDVSSHRFSNSRTVAASS